MSNLMQMALTDDEYRVISRYRDAKNAKFSDVHISFEDGLLTKLHVTVKDNPSELRTLIKGVTRIRENVQ